MSTRIHSRGAFRVVEDDFGLVRTEVLSVLDATRSHATDGMRFDWLYRNNPDGNAVLWAVRRVNSGKMAGFTVALPRRMMVNGQERVCWNGADFSILPKYRTLGLAIKLRRAAKEGIDAGRVDFLYAHPNDRMAVIHQKVGHQPVGRMIRYAKVLRTAQYLKEKVRSRALAAMAGAVLDPALRVAGREFRYRSKFDVELVSPARFDERYDRLFEEAVNCARVVGVRDARYLNWRYAENPLYETHALEAREGNRLRGYLLFTVADDVANIKDIFPPGDDDVACDLIAGMIRQGRKMRLRSLSVATLEGNPFDVRFADFGFRQRAETSQMYAYAPAGNDLGEVVTDSKSWFLTVGDRDV